MIFRLATWEDTSAIINLRLQMLRELVGSLREELPSLIKRYIEKHIPYKNCLHTF